MNGVTGGTHGTTNGNGNGSGNNFNMTPSGNQFSTRYVGDIDCERTNALSSLYQSIDSAYDKVFQ